MEGGTFPAPQQRSRLLSCSYLQKHAAQAKGRDYSPCKQLKQEKTQVPKPSASPGRSGAKADLYQMTQFFSNTVPQRITRRRLITRREQRAFFCEERRQTGKAAIVQPFLPALA